MRFVKKPIVIEAIQWDGTDYTHKRICEWKEVARNGDDLIIPTLEGNMVASLDDWIIKGVEGELYPCKPGIFDKTYDRARDEITAEVAQMVIDEGECRVSTIQKRFRIGYNRAMLVVKDLERMKIVGKAEGSKTREVYVRTLNGINF